VDLLVDQVEFANVLVISKSDLVDASADYAEDHASQLQGLLELPHGPPSADTRRPSRFASTRFNRVVFPAPRKPLSTVTSGMAFFARRASSGWRRA
jgi:hypothetical protein